MDNEVKLEFHRAIETIKDCEVAIDNGRYNNRLIVLIMLSFMQPNLYYLKKGL